MEEQNKKDKNTREKDTLPFSVFICPRSNISDIQNYKKVFTDIISDRIHEKYK